MTAKELFEFELTGILDHKQDNPFLIREAVDQMIREGVGKKDILKTINGLVQIVKCPRCLYMVTERNIIYEKSPTQFSDGVVKYCKFCEDNEKLK